MERAVGAEGRPLGSLEGKGGEGGIRTHGTLTGTPVFKTGAINRSTTSPLCPCGGGQDGAEGGEGKLKSVGDGRGPRDMGCGVMGAAGRT